DELLRRHETLRTSIDLVDDEPVQRVAPEVRLSLWPAIDLSSRSMMADRERELTRLLDEEIARPFDLRRAPLFRACMFKLGTDDHVLFFMPHHIIWDGWSFHLLHRELAALYAALSRGQEPATDGTVVTYRDFSAWHRESISGDRLTRQLSYWSDRL